MAKTPKWCTFRFRSVRRRLWTEGAFVSHVHCSLKSGKLKRCFVSCFASFVFVSWFASFVCKCSPFGVELCVQVITPDEKRTASVVCPLDDLCMTLDVSVFAVADIRFQSSKFPDMPNRTASQEGSVTMQLSIGSIY